MLDERGFTLLEVLIAFVITALALAAMSGAAVDALHASRQAERYNEAVVRARSHLAAAANGGSLMTGDWDGDDGGGYRWHLHVRAAQQAASRLTAGPAVPLALYAVTVRITWGDRDNPREVRLDTEQIGQPVGG